MEITIECLIKKLEIKSLVRRKGIKWIQNEQ